MTPWTLLLPTLLALASLALPERLSAQAVDCTGYDSQIWAQSVYNTDPAQNAGLDPDGNGVACEALQPGAAPALWTTQVPAGSEPTSLISVTDGDTIRATVAGQNEPVRLILIDTPETNDPTNAPECYGQEATAYLEWLLSLGGDVYLETDVSDRDRYDRLLRYVWLDFGDGEVYQVNEVMVRSGFAAQSTYPPDVKYVQEIQEAARFARENGYGLWSGCQTSLAGDTNELPIGRGGVASADDTAPPEAVDSAPALVAAAPVYEQPVYEEPAIVFDPPFAFGCDPSYLDVCIPSPPPDLHCGDIGA